MIAAVVDLVDAGQRIVLDRIELASIEIRAAGSATLQSVALGLLGLALLLIGWLALNAVAVIVLAGFWTHAQAIGAIAAVNLLGGAVVLSAAKRRGEAISAVGDHRRANGSSREGESA